MNVMLFLLHSLLMARIANGFSLLPVARPTNNAHNNDVLLLTKKHDSRNRESIRSSYFSLGMKPQSENTSLGTQLRFKDLSLEDSVDEYNNWIEKWAEENLFLKSVLAMHFPKMDSGKTITNSLTRDSGKNIHQRIEVRNGKEVYLYILK